MSYETQDPVRRSPFMTSTTAVFVAPGDYIDSDHPRVQAVAARLTDGVDSRAARIRAIFRFVREIPYEGDDFEDLEIFRASSVLSVGHGYCVSKASVFVAVARAARIPARIAFADVRNHLAAPRLLEAMGTDTFAWHGYAEALLNDRWVKLSPTFDSETCRRAGVEPLEFDGASDALLQSFDGRRTMKYIKHHGAFHDVPARFLSAEMRRLYPFARDRGISRFKAQHAEG